MCMAGAYQTTGERADVPGYRGWITGRGNDEMVMLKGYGHMRDFFESVAWWSTDPHPELVRGTALCLARPGELYLVYLPKGGNSALKLDPANYEARQFNPRTGAWEKLPPVRSSTWMT